MKRLEFQPSAELRSSVGESVQEGQTMELMSTFKVKENGDWCLIKIEDVAMPGYEDKGHPQESNYVNTAVANMPKGYAPA